MTCEVKLYWPVTLTENNPGAVSVAFYTPIQKSYAHIVTDYKNTDAGSDIRPRFEEKSYPRDGGNLTLSFDRKQFFNTTQPPANVSTYNKNGDVLNTGYTLSPASGPSVLHLNTVFDAECVVFTAHVYVKTHVSVNFSRKWQTCGKICVLGKYLRANRPICLPVFLQSARQVDEIKEDMIFAWLYVNSNFTCTSTQQPLTFEARLYAMFLRNVRHEECLRKEVLKFKEKERGLCISYSSHYADGVLVNKPKWMKDHPEITEDQLIWLLGTSPQSSFYYTQPVATAQFFLQNLKQCLDLHSMSFSDFIATVRGLYALPRNEHALSDENDETIHHLKRLISDVIKVYYLYFITRPYAPDISFQVVNGSTLQGCSGDFTDAFNMGDCEDGAIGIHKLMMTMWFNKWDEDASFLRLSKEDKEVFRFLRLCTGMLGLPVGVVGESKSPVSGKIGGGHMYGVVLPLKKYIQVLYGRKEDVGDSPLVLSVYKKACAWFLASFGGDYPGDLPYIIALESTMFATPRYDTYTHVHSGVKEAYGKLQEWLNTNELNSCGWGNITYTHLMGLEAINKDRVTFRQQVHYLSVRGFTSSYLHFLTDFTDYNTAFYFQSLIDQETPNGLYGDDLFTVSKKPHPFALIPSDEVTKEQYEEELWLNAQIHRPDPVLDVGVTDIFNDEQWVHLATAILSGNSYTRAEYEQDCAAHGERYAKEAYNPKAPKKHSICSMSPDTVSSDMKNINAFIQLPRSDTTELSHVTMFVYSWYPESVQQMLELYHVLGAHSVRVISYGWCTAVIFMI
jgi:hypothetical protein